MISAIIPAYNEADRIRATIMAVRTTHVSEIVVIDDGSEDETAAEAEAAGADVVYRQPNRGKGAALRTGFELSSGEILLLLDADLGGSAAEAEKLLGPVLSGVADMTIATFPKCGRKGGGAGLVVRLARWGIRRLTGRTMAAPLSGQRAVRRRAIEAVGGFADGWGVEVALTVEALRQDLRVLEVPTEMTHRVTGRSPADVLHRARQFTAAVTALWSLRSSRHTVGLIGGVPKERQ